MTESKHRKPLRLNGYGVTSFLSTHDMISWQTLGPKSAYLQGFVSLSFPHKHRQKRKNASYWIRTYHHYLYLMKFGRNCVTMEMSKSEQIRAGLQKGFQSGTSAKASTVCYGYKVTRSGELAIDSTEAKIVLLLKNNLEKRCRKW